MRNDTRDTFPPSTHDGPQRYPGDRPSYDRYTEPRDDFPMERPKHGRRRPDTRSGVGAPHRPSDRNVTIDKFDGKPGEWDNWIHQFEFIAEAYNWDSDEKMTRLVSCLRGPALTAHRSLPREERYDYEGCISYLCMRYGHCRPVARTTLRAELSVLKQEEGESVDTFADRVYALTVEAYPNMHKDLYNYLSVPAFLRGIRDRSAAQEAMKFSDPATIRTAVEAVLHIQCATRTFGGRNLSNRQVAFSDECAVNLTEKHAEETTLVAQVVQGVVRQLQQSSISLERPSNDTCFTCGGKGHRSRDCANKRRRSPSPLSCFECRGKGHLARECSNTLARRDPPVKRQSQRHRDRSSSHSSSSGTNSDDNHRYSSPRRHHANHDRRGYRSDWRERVHAVGDTGLPNVTVGRTGGTIITVGKMAGMILVEGITPTVPHMVITGEDITSLPRIITAEVPVLGVISPPFLTGRVMRQISHR